MSTSVSLRDWPASGGLTEHRRSPQEIADLLAATMKRHM